VQDINANYDVDNRLMLAKTYYETDKYYDWPTFTHFNSELRYFDRNKQLPKRTSKAYKVFFTILKDLYRIKHGVTKKGLEQVFLKLERQDNVVTRNWLSEKIEELNKSKKSSTLKKESKT